MLVNVIFIIFIILIVLFVVLSLFYRFYFLRNPKRIIPDTKHILSPADGEIIKIIDTDKDSMEIKKKSYSKINTLCSDIGKRCYVLVIMMNIFNVHYQRSPINGIVKSVKYSKGKFKNAVYGGASLVVLDNEKNEILISNNKIKLKIIQVAGVVARRIKCFVKKGQKVFKGKLIGLICLGSQVIIILPKDKAVLKVGKGKRVKAGKTIIAKYKR